MLTESKESKEHFNKIFFSQKFENSYKLQIWIRLNEKSITILRNCYHSMCALNRNKVYSHTKF